MQFLAASRNSIPVHKFLPPNLDAALLLSHRKILEDFRPTKEAHRIVFIEAQAGQGKSTLARQLLEREGASFAWYQVGREDGDPVLFLTALLSCLLGALPGFSSPLLEEMIPKGEIFASDLCRYADLLMEDLDSFLEEDFTLVLEDLHLLEENKASIGLLEYLLREGPRRLRFILTSRRPVGGISPALEKSAALLHLRGDALAFSRTEATELFHGILQLPISTTQLQEVHEATEGWVMGLLLAAHALAKGRSPSFRADGELLNYFRVEVCKEIRPDLRRTLLKLSWLHALPLELAERYAEVVDLGGELRQLARKNFFLCRLDAEGTVFRFHHLFQDGLRRFSREELAAAEIEAVLRDAAQWCLARGQVDHALDYLLLAEDYPAIATFLEREGMSLLAQGRVSLLAATLGRIPAASTGRSGWLSFFAGVVNTEVQPPAGLAPLLNACNRFAETGNGPGELLAHSHLIYYHSFIDCDFKSISAHLPQAEKLYGQLRDALPDPLQIHVLYCLSVGYSFLHADTARNDQFAQTALALAERHGLDNFTAMIRSINGIAHLFAGDWAIFTKQMEASFPLLHSKRIGAVSKLNLYAFPLNYLSGRGDLGNFLRFESSVRRELAPELYVQSAMAPFILLFKTELLLGEGRLEEAREMSDASLLLHPHGAASCHLKSQFLHYRALVFALLQRPREALAAATESLAQRQAAGGKIFVLLNHYLLGAALAQIRHDQAAEESFRAAMGISLEIGEEYLRAGIHAHRAWLRLQQGEELAAREDLALFLGLMRSNKHSYFYGWVPEVMRPLLQTAVRLGIEGAYARYLAGKRLGLDIMDNGSAVPLLEIRTFGGLAMAVAGEVILWVEDFSRTQRELLAYLLVAPGLKCSQEKVQDALWPEASPAKARSNLDTLLLRLRKTLEGNSDLREAKHYILLHKGILQLRNCRIDALEFGQVARKGLAHYRRKEHWQAGHAFSEAYGLWTGPFLPNGPLTDAIRDFRQELSGLFSEIALKWGKLLLLTDGVEAVLPILRQALRYDRTNDELVRELYQLLVAAKNPRGARELLREYAENLRLEDCDEAEIGEILEGVVLPR